jgi:poly(hydroxyalkanoate) granule-associated protein
MAKKKDKKGKKDLSAEMKESVHKVWLAGLGALAAAEEEGSKLFKNLVEKGEGYEGRGRARYEDFKGQVEDAADRAKGQAESTWNKVEDRLDEAVTAALGRLGVPSRDEIATLTKRVEELTKVVEELSKKEKGASKPAAKSTARASKASTSKAATAKAAS